VFGDLPVDVDELRGADDAAVIDAVTGWARLGAAADARKYAAIAELARRRTTGEHARWACDDEAAAAAEVAAALNIGHGRASGEMDLAVVLRDRFPKVAALFLAGDVTARRVWLIANRTYLVTQPGSCRRTRSGDRRPCDRVGPADRSLSRFLCMSCGCLVDVGL
jgi:hypothetical protein